MNSFSSRFKELLGAMDDLVFNQLDTRLINYLRKKSLMNGSSEIKTTHQEIAVDLNTSREVISRLLLKMKKNGEVELKRNAILIT